MNLQILLAISAILFAFGLAGALSRSNAIMILIGIELMLGAGNLNFVVFWRCSESPDAMVGILFAIFSIAIAAAEAAVGLAIIILVHRRINSVEADDASHLKG
jgi:NADH-quinone oxidoreductase subunit K